MKISNFLVACRAFLNADKTFSQAKGCFCLLDYQIPAFNTIFFFQKICKLLHHSKRYFTDNKEEILTEIQETLSQISENHLQNVIQSFYESLLLAQNTTIPQVTEAALQAYLEQLRKTFSLMMKKDLGIQAAYDSSHLGQIVIKKIQIKMFKINIKHLFN